MVDRRGRGIAAVRPLLDEEITINVCLDPVDFRMGINGLSVLIEASLKYDPFSRNLFCFTNKRRNQIKVLYWERSGFCLWLKRLEEERFKWPLHLPGRVAKLTPEQAGKATKFPSGKFLTPLISGGTLLYVGIVFLT